MPIRSEWTFETPGVYLQEGFNPPRRDPFETGIPVFIGRCATTPKSTANKLQQLTMWSQFPQDVGKTYPDCVLGYAVRGFFQNGGNRCYVLVIEEVNLNTLQAALEIACGNQSVDLVCVPDLGDDEEIAVELRKMLVNHCDHAGDRFAILDTSRSDQLKQAAEMWSEIDGTNGALYHPWVIVRNFDEQGTGAPGVLVPACGHVAGVYARTDSTRGVHKAPANEVLEGVLGLGPQGKQPEHEVGAFTSRINSIRSFPGRGIRVWGTRTLSSTDAWTYINVRRVFLTAVRWIEWHMRWVAFEPNDGKLWATIEGELQQYFLSLYRAGALQGATAQQAYYVRCNEQTNPREMVEAGQVVAEIGLAASIPFEFVVVRLIYGASGVSISGPTRQEQNI